MSETEKRDEWARFYQASPEGYKPNALQAVLLNDGEKMLSLVLKKLHLEKSVDLVKDWA